MECSSCAARIWTALHVLVQHITACCLQALSPLLPQVFTLFFGVLTSPTRRGTKTTVGFITCVSRMICMHGAEPILGAMEAAQAGSARAVFTEVFPNNLDKVSAGDDKRVVGLALTRALCEHDAFLSVRVSSLLPQLIPVHDCELRKFIKKRFFSKSK
jgi:hypothetical protein